MERQSYRLWAAAKRGDDLVAQGDHPSLESALEKARALATRAVVAIEVPGKRWHTFAESGREVLGPLEEEPAEPASADEEPSDRRRSPRFSTAGMRGESVSHLGDGTPVRLLDISADGVQLQLPSRYRLANGREISLRIRSKRGAVDVTGVVAWVRRGRCGLRFDWDSTPTFAKTYIRGLISDADR